MNPYRPASSGVIPASALPARLASSFDDLYTAVYAILDDAKTDRDLVKLYKGSHGSPDPHPIVTDFGEYFYRTRRGLLAYAATRARAGEPPTLGDLARFDAEHTPRLSTRAVFDLLYPAIRRPGESPEEVLDYLVCRTHKLGAYRGGSSGYDDEARAFAAAHFRAAGLGTTPGQVLVFCGGAKGAFTAFCAALMCRRHHDDINRMGGLLLAPVGYYQSLRLIPPLFGGDIHVTADLTGDTVQAWLADTDSEPRRCVYVPLINNADGRVLTRDRADSVAAAVLEHNAQRPDRPVYVLADDVYAGSHLTPDRVGVPIATVTGADLGAAGLGRMSDWTLTVTTASKTYALPTARVAFATTANSALAQAVAHYRTVLSHGRVPQSDELTAAAAICWTPQHWIDEWNHRYRIRLAKMRNRIDAINADLGFPAVQHEMPQGGWYLPMQVSPALVRPARSSVDVFAALLHYDEGRDSGIGMLPGELFGYGRHQDSFLLRGTVAASDDELRRFTDRLHTAAQRLTGPDGPAIVEAAMTRARKIADVDAILANRRY